MYWNEDDGGKCHKLHLIKKESRTKLYSSFFYIQCVCNCESSTFKYLSFIKKSHSKKKNIQKRKRCQIVFWRIRKNNSIFKDFHLSKNSHWKRRCFFKIDLKKKKRSQIVFEWDFKRSEESASQPWHVIIYYFHSFLRHKINGPLICSSILSLFLSLSSSLF